MAQLVEHLTLDFGSGQDPRVVGWDPPLGSILGIETIEILFLLVPLPLPLARAPTLSLFLSKKKKIKKNHVVDLSYII